MRRVSQRHIKRDHRFDIKAMRVMKSMKMTEICVRPNLTKRVVMVTDTSKSSFKRASLFSLLYTDDFRFIRVLSRLLRKIGTFILSPNVLMKHIYLDISKYICV